MQRRTFLRAIGGALASTAPSSHAKQNEAPNGVTETVTVERQKGDPDAVYEYVTFSGSAIKRMSERPEGRATFQPWVKDLPSRMMAVAHDFVGVSRDTAPEQVTEFLALFHLPYQDAHGPLAFCAAGLSYCALSAFASQAFPSLDPHNKLLTQYRFRTLMADVDHYYFYPTVSCSDMFYIAAGRHRWIDGSQLPKAIPKPGWIVLFDWSKSGTPDHCGLVTSATAAEIFTIEFNTSGVAGGSERNGGTVSAKRRTYQFVRGFIITDTKPLDEKPIEPPPK